MNSLVGLWERVRPVVRHVPYGTWHAGAVWVWKWEQSARRACRLARLAESEHEAHSVWHSRGTHLALETCFPSIRGASPAGATQPWTTSPDRCFYRLLSSTAGSEPHPVRYPRAIAGTRHPLGVDCKVLKQSQFGHRDQQRGPQQRHMRTQDRLRRCRAGRCAPFVLCPLLCNFAAM